MMGMAAGAVAALGMLVSASPYTVSWGRDGVLTGGLLAGAALVEAAVKPSMGGDPSCTWLEEEAHCDPSALNAVDRSVVGNRSAAWKRVSDAGELTGIVVPLAGAFLLARFEGGSGWARDGLADALVIGESLALANAVTTLLKLAVRRPRPTQYEGDASRLSFEHQVSFPSGHTTAAAAGTTAFAMTYAWRHPGHPSRWAVLAAAALVTGVTAYGRVGAGVHFYSDVLGGALVGATVGVLVPMAHRRVTTTGITARPLVASAGRRGLVLSWVW